MPDANLTSWLETVATTLAVAVVVYAALAVRAQAQSSAQAATVAKLVRAAEQMLPGASGEEKLAWVLAQVREFLPRLRISDALLRVLIESEVQQIHAASAQPPRPKAKPALTTGT